jgi:uncharacterized SAM-binding protein YcdF (DUF218 family)
MKKHAIFMMCRTLLIALGLLLLLNALGVSMASNFNLGIVLAALLGAFVLGCGIFLPLILRRCPRWLCITALSAICLVMLCATALLLFGRTDTVTKDEDAIIVLGAGIHGERVSLTLRDRLNAAIDCYEQNPDALIVVSGGQGPQEDISEALAMERYLVEHGIPADHILKEDRSTSTAENFAFSKALLDERFGESYSTAYVTNDFHILRAGQVAHRAGFDDISHAHSNTVWYLVVPSCLRECVAVLWYWVMGG